MHPPSLEDASKLKTTFVLGLKSQLELTSEAGAVQTRLPHPFGVYMTRSAREWQKCFCKSRQQLELHPEQPLDASQPLAKGP
jgi:hypothetical protein